MTAKRGPCEHCPFRHDRIPVVTLPRAKEIAGALRNNGTFHCHKTVDYSRDDGVGRSTSKSKSCTGANIVMEKEGVLDLNQMARIEMRLGMLNPDELDLNANVPDSLSQWIRLHHPRGGRR